LQNNHRQIFRPLSLDVLSLLLEWAHERALLVQGLEATVSNLGRGVDEFQFDLLHVLALVVGDEWASKHNRALPASHARALDDEELVLDFTIVGKSSKRGDGLLGEISGGAGLVLDDFLALDLGVSLSDTVDLFVDLDSVVVTLLTSARDGVANAGWMPSTDTGNLSETSMRLSGELLGAPSRGHTLASMTLGNSDAVNVLVLFEHGSHRDWLLKQSSGKVDLVGYISSVDLELENVSLLLLQWEALHLGMSNESDNGAVLLHLGQSGVNAASVVLPFGRVLSKSLLFAVGVVLVEPPAEFVADVLGPDGLEGPESTGGLDIPDYTDPDHRGCFQDGDWLDDLLFVELGTLSVDLPDNMGHTSLVSDETGQMASLGLVVFRVGLNSAEMPPRALAWEKSL